MNIDRKIQQDVLNELTADPAVNAEHIGVTVCNHIVTLTGHVDSFYEKWAAEKATQRVTGVQGLAIEIDVNIPRDRHRNDEDIARMVQSLLSWNTAIPKDTIKVMVEKGWVTLSGEVGWNYQREIAHKAVAGLAGVNGITDQITLIPMVTGEKIKERIEEALKRMAVLDASKVNVKVAGNQVTLEGCINNLSEREVIRRAIWATRGVHFLIDHLRFESPQKNQPMRAPIL